MSLFSIFFFFSLFLIIQLMANLSSFVKCMYELMSNVLMKNICYFLVFFIICQYKNLM